jgi:hypothetical protein
MIVAANTWQPYCSQNCLLVSDDVLFLSNAVTTQEWSTVNDYRQESLQFTLNYAFISNILLQY